MHYPAPQNAAQIKKDGEKVIYSPESWFLKFSLKIKLKEDEFPPS